MMNEEAYRPISCALHDEYEIAIMHKKYLAVRWLDDSGERHTDKVLPKDILVKNKEEFLIAADQNNNEFCIRLDKISLLDR
jgi:transcriptional antiterminator Rof (Rho-off)